MGESAADIVRQHISRPSDRSRRTAVALAHLTYEQRLALALARNGIWRPGSDGQAMGSRIDVAKYAKTTERTT